MRYPQSGGSKIIAVDLCFTESPPPATVDVATELNYS